MKIKCIDSLSKIPPSDWQKLESEDFPFTDYNFLWALEASGSLGSRTGWFPQIICLYDDKTLLGAIPQYAKGNSYGEYIFDWEWAQAYQQNGLDYYPKLTVAIPFTPATGQKLLLHRDHSRLDLEPVLLKALDEAYQAQPSASSLHHLFIPEYSCETFKKHGYDIRHSSQYHWQNNDYQDFEDFLSTLKGKKAKEIRRERRDVTAQGIEVRTLNGSDIKAHYADKFFEFYLSTIGKRGAYDYLTQAFFQQTFISMADNVVLSIAERDGEWLACSLSFKKGKHLYGRYWGSREDCKHLHFELCYYKLIEYAIEQKLELFEAGAQGQHKLRRGFLPCLTYSAHKIRHPAFAQGIQGFIEEEKMHLNSHIEREMKSSPYKTI